MIPERLNSKIKTIVNITNLPFGTREFSNRVQMISDQYVDNCRISPISTRFTFKRPSPRLFRFEISQFAPFCMKTPKNPPKEDTL